MKEILSKVAPLYGICPFESVKNNLIDCRAKGRLPKNAKSIIIFAFPYLLEKELYEDRNISKYAVPMDYHKVLMSRLTLCCEELSVLYENEEFVPFADNSPIPEVQAACLGGLGVLGENSLLITKDYGSFVFLGEIVTTLKLDPTGNKEISNCLKCNKCVEVCPNSAIKEGKISLPLCLSHITQQKGELTQAEKDLIKKTKCAWGCDICQDICPLNRNAKTTDISEFIDSALAKVDRGTPLTSRAFAWRGEEVIKRNVEIIKGD